MDQGRNAELLGHSHPVAVRPQYQFKVAATRMPWLFEEKDREERDAFMAAVDEYNSYGAALHNTKWQIDENTAAQMYGFKAWLD